MPRGSSPLKNDRCRVLWTKCPPPLQKNLKHSLLVQSLVKVTPFQLQMTGWKHLVDSDHLLLLVFNQLNSIYLSSFYSSFLQLEVEHLPIEKQMFPAPFQLNPSPSQLLLILIYYVKQLCTEYWHKFFPNEL